MQKAIIDLFSVICRPFKDKEGGEKLDVLKEILAGVNISHEYIPGIGLIINRQDNPRAVLTSHMDLIKKFQKGFLENNTFEIVVKEDGEKLVKGALDNTITNSVALLVLEELLNKGISDVEVVLTEGEEVGMKGMEEYLVTFPDKSASTFFVNLDVTNEGWKKDISVEYDAANFKMLKQIQLLLQDHSAFYTKHRVGDDIDAVIDAKCSGFSYCLPTKDLIHSYDNKARVESLAGYYHGLVKLLAEISFDESHVEVFDSYYFSKALTIESEEEFEKHMKANPPVKTFSGSFDPNKFSMLTTPVKKKEKLPLTKEDVIARERFVDIVSSSVKEHFGIDSLTMEEVSGFIEYQAMEDEEFFLSEFALLFKFKKDHFAFARKILDWLVEEMYVEEITLSEYRFNI